LLAFHLGLECLQLKAKPASNGFRRDDNRTVAVIETAPAANTVIA